MAYTIDFEDKGALDFDPTDQSTWWNERQLDLFFSDCPQLKRNESAIRAEFMPKPKLALVKGLRELRRQCGPASSLTKLPLQAAPNNLTKIALAAAAFLLTR